MANNEILIEYLNRVKDDIINEQRALGIRLTGRSANSLRVERTRSGASGRFEAGASLTSLDYLPTNFKDIGVRPGVFPPFGPGSKLEQWVKRRGLKATDAEGRVLKSTQIAFLVARKIHARGTDIFNRGGIDVAAITRNSLPETMEELAIFNASEIRDNLNLAIIV